MKYLVLLTVAFSFNNLVEAACNRPVDPKKIVLMVAFHEGGEEERGAIAGACARGEKLVIIPKVTQESKRAQESLERVSRQISTAYDQCVTAGRDNCDAQASAGYEELQRLSAAVEASKPDFQAQIEEFTRTSSAQGAKVNSLILSGHDGAGHFYGSYGETDIAGISDLVSKNRDVFGDTSSLLLMGCWTGVPDQVDVWKTIFPKVRVMGGFVGSAPSSTRLAAGQYVQGILRGEANLPDRATRAQVQSMINNIQNINQVTAGVYINPACEEENSRSPAYYYVSPSQADNELPGHIRPGLSVYQGISTQEATCRRTFGHQGAAGTYDWNAVQQYFQGHREPENNNELRSLYSYLRNSEYCFTQGFSEAAVTPDQVLFLRFFQDTKKNIGKYFKADLESMYEKLDAAVAALGNSSATEFYKNHKKLVGASLEGMTRKETLQQISVLTRVFDMVASSNPDAPGIAQIRNGMQKLDLHLYRLKCMPATWHEYDEVERLAPPTCSE